MFHCGSQDSIRRTLTLLGYQVPYGPLDQRPNAVIRVKTSSLTAERV